MGFILCKLDKRYVENYKVQSLFLYFVVLLLRYWRN